MGGGGLFICLYSKNNFARAIIREDMLTCFRGGVAKSHLLVFRCKGCNFSQTRPDNGHHCTPQLDSTLSVFGSHLGDDLPFVVFLKQNKTENVCFHLNTCLTSEFFQH